MTLTPPTLNKLLHQKLLNLGGVIFLIGCLTFGTLFYYTARNSFVRRSQAVTMSLAHYVESYINNALTSLDHIALDLVYALRSGADTEFPLGHGWGMNPRFARLMLVSPDRLIVASEPSGIINIDFPFPLHPIGDHPQLLGAPTQLEDGTMVVYLGHPLDNGYLLIGALKLETLQNHINSINPGRSETVMLANQWGTIISHPDPRAIRQQDNIGYLPFFKPGADLSTSEYFTVGDDGYIGFATRVPNIHWLLVTQTPLTLMVREIMSGVGQFLFFLMLSFVLFSIGFSVEIRRALLIPLSRLTDSMRSLADGQLQPVPERKNSFAELAVLRDTYNSMASTIRTREQELARARQYIKSIIDSMPSVIIGLDTDMAITHLNHAAEEWAGASEKTLTGTAFEQAFPDLMPHFNAMLDALDRNEPHLLEKRLYQDGTTPRYHDILIYPLTDNGMSGVVLRVDDVTDRARIEDMMVQTEKMMSVGGLAAGMAHEINNPLGAILQGAQNIERRISSDLPANLETAERVGCPLSSIRQYLEERQVLTFLRGIREAGTRAADIVANMLDFSRKTDARRSSVDLHKALDKTIELASNDYDLKKRYDFRAIRIVRDFDPNVRTLVCSSNEIEQVLLNLLRNAAQAMQNKQYGPGEGPRICIRTRQEEDFVLIAVEDNGPGMEEKIRKRVFEPFFTTKDIGEGTGLGLSVSYFIITENHRGMFDVTSTPGVGTTFAIRLPVTNSDTGSAAITTPR